MTVMNVDCRIGSLENDEAAGGEGVRVDCRIGSLENAVENRKPQVLVDCRIGSLEITLDMGGNLPNG